MTNPNIKNRPGPDDVVKTPNREIDLGPDFDNKHPLRSALSRGLETYEGGVSAHFDDSYSRVDGDGGMGGELF